MHSLIPMSAIFAEALRLGRLRFKTLAVIWLIVVVAYGIVDLTIVNENLYRSYGVLGLVAYYLQILTTAYLLSGADLPDFEFNSRSPTEGRFVSALGLSLIWWAGVIIGGLLFVIPGVVLLVRWSISLQAFVGEKLGISESLRRSWVLTGNYKKLTAGVVLICMLLYLPTGFASLLYPDFGAPSAIAVAIVNSLFGLGMIGNLLLMSALYVLLRRSGQTG